MVARGAFSAKVAGQINIRGVVPLRGINSDGSAWRSSAKVAGQINIRGVAQMVARLLWEQEVPGSNPGTPTKLFKSR
jgi:hypothetical protein